jgi:hypothetical protein
MKSDTNEPQPQAETQVVAMRKPDFAKRWSISLRALDSLIADSIVPTIKLGRRLVRIPVEAADAALMAYTTGGKEVA